MQKTIDWNEIRLQFPIFKSKTYINSCSYGALASSVDDAFQAYLSDRYTYGSDWYNWVIHNENLRSNFAELFGAIPDEIAVTTSASAGMNSVASSLDFSGKRNKIIITELDFPTSSQIWFAQEKRGARIVRVYATQNKTLVERLAEEIDEETLLVSVTHVCYRNGKKQDIKAIRDLARKQGAYIFVDGYQAIGTMKIDLKALDLDFYVGGTLKYLLGTAGVAFLYVNQKIISKITPSVTGWFAQDDIHAMDDTCYNPSNTARRFEAGTPPVPAIYACQAGLVIIKEIGLANIEARIANITADIVKRAHDLGYTLATPADPAWRGAMVAIKSTDENSLVAALDERGVVASCRDGNLRLSPHFYNTHEDVEKTFAELKHIDLMVK